MFISYISEDWSFFMTTFCSIWTSGCKFTSDRCINRTRDISLQHNRFLGFTDRRVKLRNCRHQCFCIWVQCLFIQFFCLCKFHQRAKVHNTYFLGNMSDHRKIMCNKQISKSKTCLQIFKHIYYLCLNTDIKCRNRLIADYKIRIYRKCSCNPDTLPLST